jgi:hypothetical protein
MRNKQIVLTAVLAMVAGLYGGAELNGIFKVEPMRAQVPEANSTRRQLWEHCSLVPVNNFPASGGKIKGAAMIYYVRDHGLQSERVEAVIDGDARRMEMAQNSAMAKAISKLSNEEWQMVGEGGLFPYTSVDQKLLYFRRPKP